MKKLLLTIIAFCSIALSYAQTEGWQQMKSLNDNIATRFGSQMESYKGKLYFFGGMGWGLLVV